MALGDLTLGQRDALDRLAQSDLVEVFYLSGGTALSAFHLHHRRSDDLDLFARDRFDGKAVLELVNSISEIEAVPRRVHDRLGFVIQVRGEPLRVEFVHYAFDCLEPPVPRHGRLRVDGLRDILANKLSAVVERTEPKDFADLLFLLRLPTSSLAQGIADCRNKFGWPGLEYVLQSAFLRAGHLPGWPETEPATTKEEAGAFFREAARTLIRVEDEP